MYVTCLTNLPSAAIGLFLYVCFFFFDFLTDRNGNSFVRRPIPKKISLEDPNTNYVHNEDHNHEVKHSMVGSSYLSCLSLSFMKLNIQLSHKLLNKILSISIHFK
jgi:hypothetical protein